MFSHVMIGTNNLDKAKAFYDKVLGALGVPGHFQDRHRIFYRHKDNTFSVSQPINGEPATAPNGGTIGFACDSPNRSTPGTRPASRPAEPTCEDPPGVREGQMGNMYLAYLKDPTATSSAPCTGCRAERSSFPPLHGEGARV